MFILLESNRILLTFFTFRRVDLPNSPTPHIYYFMTNIFSYPNHLLSATGDQTILRCARVLMDRSKMVIYLYEYTSTF